MLPCPAAIVVVMSSSTDSEPSYFVDRFRASLPQSLRGIARAGAILAEKAQMRIFDALTGVSTTESLITEGSLFVAGGENTAYAACQWLSVRSALKALSPGDRDVFVDIGAGKGKAMLIAARLGYGRVLGVERDVDLAGQARQNVALARRHLKTPGLDVITADALEWRVPDDVSVVFLNNPFIGTTLHQVAMMIIDSYDQKRRPLYIVYSKPWEHDWLLSTGRLSVVGVTPRFWPAQPGWWRTGDVIVTYQVVAKDGGSTGGGTRAPRWSRSQRALARWSVPNAQVYKIFTNDHGVFSSNSLQ
jgi:SAM-dependent methyltransferase